MVGKSIQRFAAGLLMATTVAFGGGSAGAKVDFNRDIRPFVSNTCFVCHGPDEAKRKAKLRLDMRDEALKSGAIVPGKPEQSPAYKRVSSKDPDEQMPPPGFNHQLTPEQINLFKQWISEGAEYKKHWSYEKPVRPAVPQTKNTKWARNPIDSFILERLEKAGLSPQPEADKYALLRRVTLDLTGLPPTPEETDAYAADTSPKAYEKVVDRLLTSPAYGEHQARQWLDLARYADSAGYADDPPRTIWAYRDYVIKSFNQNKPFDQFTTEQIAGDLLPNPTDDQLIATAFHRNTMTNSEGGTDDEEFRNAAIVDRVNTTMSVWMGTSMACAQCHTHKYDPLTQKEYFQLFAFFNQSADTDQKDESPLLSFLTEEQKQQKLDWGAERMALEKKLREPSPEISASADKWAQGLSGKIDWQTLSPDKMQTQSGVVLTADKGVITRPDVQPAPVNNAAGEIKTTTENSKKEVYTLEAPLAESKLAALRLEVLPPETAANSTLGTPANDYSENSRVTRVRAALVPPGVQSGAKARFVRIELPGKGKLLQLAEVQVFSGGENVALRGEARQSSTYAEAVAKRAIDGNTAGEYEIGSVAHTGDGDENPWWEVDLKAEVPIERIVIWNRTELPERMQGFRLVALDEKRKPVWEKANNDAPKVNAEFAPDGAREIKFVVIVPDAPQAMQELQGIIGLPIDKPKAAFANGWAINGGARSNAFTNRWLALLPETPVDMPPGAHLRVTIEQQQVTSTRTINNNPPVKSESAPLNRFRLAASADPRSNEYLRLPDNVRAALDIEETKREYPQKSLLREHYARYVAPDLAPTRERIATLDKQINGLQPITVPVMRELSADKARKTFVELRGSYLAKADEVSPAVPAAFAPLPADAPANRLALARWLVSDDNPLTARVIANRYWESLFGIGLVRTSEEFGSQGEWPTHPELLDWLATELMSSKWDLKKFQKLLVMSAAYCQSSKVTPELLEKDPENLLISRGPRFRMSAEMVRDEALAVSGLLSRKMYGPPVRPIRPNMGLNAAFGGGLDWQTSAGEDRHRRALYTEWRRTSPYPSLVTFDAPNREVCTLRRARTNTPLQALVTLNDPVYVESAQALARRIAAQKGSDADKVRFALRLCLSRPAQDKETQRLLQLHDEALAVYKQDAKKAMALATEPLGPLPPDTDAAELAAWTTVANVILNLDEMLMKR
jgi:hypothetical protein